MTSWPNPHPLKALSRFVRPVLRDLTIDWPEQNPVEAPAGQWTRLPSEAASSDVVVGQAGQPITLSPVAAQLFGQAFTIENVGAQDNQDTGFCLCSVHGGLEMGGGLIPRAIDTGWGTQCGRHSASHDSSRRCAAGTTAGLCLRSRDRSFA